MAATIAVTIITAAATAAVSEAAKQGVDAAIALIGDISDWTTARETFTQTTVKTMFRARPDGYVAAVCCNQAYGLKDASLASEVTSVELKSGELYTDYDCLFLKAGNSFYTYGETGFINYADVNDESCEFQANGDLYC